MRRSHAPRWFAAVLALLAVALSASACSPATRRNVALFLDDGHPTALLHHCPEAGITSLSVTDRSTPSAPDPSSTHTSLYVPYWAVRTDGKDVQPTEVRLLTVPAGWRLDTDTPFLLEEFVDGDEYYLDTNDAGFRGISFTIADLDSLTATQVFALAEDGDSQAMTRDEFARIALNAC